MPATGCGESFSRVAIVSRLPARRRRCLCDLPRALRRRRCPIGDDADGFMFVRTMSSAVLEGLRIVAMTTAIHSSSLPRLLLHERTGPARFAWGSLAVSGFVFGILVAFAERYGYHRDELYFLVAGRHLAWGYPDQPPLVPLVARLVGDLAPGSVTALRLPSAVVAAAIAPLTAALAREFGGERHAQLLAAGSIGVSSVLIGAGHTLNTTTFDLLAWVLIVLFVTVILRGGDERLWFAVGLVAGAGLLDSDLVAFLLAALLGGIAIAGPRHTFRSPWLWAGGMVAAAMWAPYLVWQARHGWPELTVSRGIANGASGSSTPRWLFLPEQLAVISVFLAPVWIAGLVRLFRAAELRFARAIGWAYALLAVVFVIAGGKAYYLLGIYPPLLAAGAQPTLNWTRRGRRRLRRVSLALSLVLSAVIAVAVALPVTPIRDLHNTPFQYDIGETVAWPTYVREIAAAWNRLPGSMRAHAAILTSNYGEAGAVDRYGPALGLPTASSGHMGFWYWGPPQASATAVLGVGFDPGYLERFFVRVRLISRLNNHLQVNNDEQRAPLWLATGLRQSWTLIWPQLKNLG
jgi:Dolichyl-phosphate-mannose-protein mannosyltransferase